MLLISSLIMVLKSNLVVFFIIHSVSIAMVFSEVSVTQSLVFNVVFCRTFFFGLFLFGYCVVCPC